MEQNNFRKIICFGTLAAALLMPTNIGAYDFVEGGLAYNVLSDGTSVEVTSFTEHRAPAYENLTTPVVIPSSVTNNGKTYSVTAIGDFAFDWCTDLPAVTIPETVTYIGVNAFYCCYALTDVFIPKSVIAIEEDAFSFDRGLTKIVVESGNPRYDSRDECNAIIETATGLLLFGCINTQIPEGVTELGMNSFASSRIKSLKLPSTLKVIGEMAFLSCRQLEYMEFPASVSTIKSYAFQYCTALKNVKFNEGLETIEKQVFYGAALTEVFLPNSLKSVGSQAFSYSSVYGVALGNGPTKLDDYIFYECPNLIEVVSLIVNPDETSFNIFAFYPKSGGTRTLYVPKGSKTKYLALDNFDTCFDEVIELSGINGDVSNDGVVNVGDVSVLFDAILGGNMRFITRYLGDLNGDDVINAGDVSELYSIITSK